MRFFRRLVIPTAILGLVSLACAMPRLGNNQLTPQTGTSPVVAITNPTTGQKLELGGEVQILSTAADPEGIVRIELLVDGNVIWVDANADPQPNTPFIVAQPWTPDLPGSHVIQVRAYDKDNTSGESAAVTVEVLAASAQAIEAELPASTAEPGVSPSIDTPVARLQDGPTSTAPAPAAPTSTPAPPAATPTPSPTITLPTPTVTPTPGLFAATGLLPEGRFKDIWQEVGAGESRLGYPTDPAVVERDFAKQYFERGLLYWWDNPNEPDYVWAIDSPEPDLRSGATSNRYTDEWDGEDDYSCKQARANGDKGPVRGFGWLWCQRAELQARLGNPIETEAGSGGHPPFSQVQFFQGGVMLYNPLNAELYVLYDQGDWQRFKW